MENRIFCNKIKQQQLNNLEKFVNLECDLEVKKNILSAINILENYKFNDNYYIHDLFKIICKKQFNKKINFDIDLTKLAIIKTTAKISFISEDHKKQWHNHPRYNKKIKYVDKYKYGENMPPIILSHPNVLQKYINKNNYFSIKNKIISIFSKFKVPENLFQIDGMHRVMSALEAEQNHIETYVVINREDIHHYLPDNDKNEIIKIADTCTWFPRYQEIKEVGLEGKRKQDSRYYKIYNFTNLKNKVVIDFGGNIGQAAIEAFFNGAKKIINLDIQQEAIETGKIISKILGLNIIHSTINFNKDSFKNDVLKLVLSWDWAIFQAIYRTKEIKNIKNNFNFIVKNTKEGIIFEGNADPKLDTDEFYQNIFKEYNFKSIKFLGHHENRPAYIIEI
jgi:hypothetical protein